MYNLHWCYTWTALLSANQNRVICNMHTITNESGAVLLPFQKDLRPHLLFSYHFCPSTLQHWSSEKLHGTCSICPPFWILTIDWSGARSCLFWWCHHFQIALFSPSTLENSVFKRHSFQITPLSREFSNGSLLGDRFRCCSVDDNCIRSKTALFLFENTSVWTRPKYYNMTRQLCFE